MELSRGCAPTYHEAKSGRWGSRGEVKAKREVGEVGEVVECDFR